MVLKNSELSAFDETLVLLLLLGNFDPIIMDGRCVLNLGKSNLSNSTNGRWGSIDFNGRPFQFARMS